MDNLEVKRILVEEALRKNNMAQVFNVVANEKWYFLDHFNNIKTTNYY